MMVAEKSIAFLSMPPLMYLLHLQYNTDFLQEATIISQAIDGQKVQEEGWWWRRISEAEEIGDCL